MPARSALPGSYSTLQLHRFLTLLNLPEELLDHIIVYICDDFISLKKTRATCRGLARITTPYVFGTVHITLSKKSIENFINIGLNNALAPLVRELVFHGQIPRKFPDQETWERYIHLGLEEDGLGSGNLSWYEYDRYGYENKNPPHEPEKLMRDLNRYYQAYKEYQHAPEHFNDCYSLNTISADNPMLYSYRYFSVAIGMLKNLRFAQVTCHDPMDNFHPVWRNFRREILQGPSDWTSYTEKSLASFEYADHQLEGVTQLTCLLHALGVAGPRVNLRSLKFSTDGHYFWLQDQIKIRHENKKLVKNSLALMAPAFINLRELDVYVIYSTTNRYNYPMVTTLAGFLRSALNLEMLRVEFREADWAENSAEDPHFDLLAHLISGSWPQLKRLTLNLSTTEQSLKSFLRKIGLSLRALNLESVTFFENCGSWENLLIEMPKLLALDSVYLENLCEFRQGRLADSLVFFKDAENSSAPFSCHYQAMERYILRKTSERPPLDLEEFSRFHGECNLCTPSDGRDFPGEDMPMFKLQG